MPMKSRAAGVVRDTQETQITVKLNLDGTGRAKLASGVPFLDHMLDQIAPPEKAYNFPLVDGTPFTRGSSSTAMRSARPKALKSVST